MVAEGEDADPGFWDFKGSIRRGRMMKMDISDFPASLDLKNANLGQFGTILADPPWRFSNRTGKMVRSIKGFPDMER